MSMKSSKKIKKATRKQANEKAKSFIGFVFVFMFYAVKGPMYEKDSPHNGNYVVNFITKEKKNGFF